MLNLDGDIKRSNMTTNALTITGLNLFDMSGLESGSIFSKQMTKDKSLKRLDNINVDILSDSISNKQSLNSRSLKNKYLTSILNKLEEMYIVGDKWHEDELEGPNINTIELSTSLTYQFIENDFFPTVVTQTVEEGICFVFGKNKRYLYLEIYNDGEIGIIIEDYSSRKIMSNKSVTTIKDIISEVSQFLYK